MVLVPVMPLVLITLDSRVNFSFLVEISWAKEPSREEALLGALLVDEMASLLKENYNRHCQWCHFTHSIIKMEEDCYGLHYL